MELRIPYQLLCSVDENIKSGREKMVIDPVPDKIYTKRKARVSNISKDTAPLSSVMKYLSDGWETSLERMPSFTRAEMKQLMPNSGKRVANAEHHTIPNLWRAKTFLGDEYLKDIEANSDQRYFYLKAKCYHSFKKI